MLFNSSQILTDYKYWFDQPMLIEEESRLRPSEFSSASLLPFFDETNKPYNSDKVFKIQSLYYTYDWVWNKDGRSDDTKLSRTNLRRMLNTQFSTTRSE